MRDGQGLLCRDRPAPAGAGDSSTSEGPPVTLPVCAPIFGLLGLHTGTTPHRVPHGIDGPRSRRIVELSSAKYARYLLARRTIVLS